MRIAVMNYTGTVGKTTLAANLLKIRMPKAEIIAVESVNENAADLGLEVKLLSGERFREIFLRLLKTQDAIIDVGASNIEAFLDGMAKFEGSHLEIDFFVIPVTSGTKEQKETLAMVKLLCNFGVHRDKIKVVFNRVNSDAKIEFEILFKYMKSDPIVALNPAAAVMENEVYDLMGRKQTTLQAVLSDPTDYRAMLREVNAETDPKLVHQYADAYSIWTLAVSVHRNLDQVFEALFGGAA